MKNFTQPDSIDDNTINCEGVKYIALFSFDGTVYDSGIWTVYDGVHPNVKDWIEKYGGVDAVALSTISAIEQAQMFVGDADNYRTAKDYNTAKSNLDKGLVDFCKKAASYSSIDRFLITHGDEDIQIVAVKKRVI